MNKHFLTIILGFSCLIFAGRCFAQATGIDSTLRHTAAGNTISDYYKAIAKGSRQYNGLENLSYPRYMIGSAYYRDSTYLTNGSVDYDGIVYYDVPLLYDIYKDIVISVLPDHISKYSFLTERVKSFDVYGGHFVRILSDTTNLKTGFYDEAYHNKLRVLIRFEKSIQNRTSGLTIESYFEKSTGYYLKKDKIYYSANSQGAVFKILKDKKKQLKQYLRANKLKFRKDPERILVLLAAYYDSLPN